MSDDEPDFFEENIETNREVCSNCFRKVIIVIPKEERTPLHANESIKRMIADGRYPGKESEMCYPSISDVNQRHTPSTGIACECGVIDHDTKLRPLNKDQMIGRSKRLLNRLEAMGYDVDKDEFFDVVRSMKEDPNKQFDDREIFATAIEDSVNHG